MSSIIDAIEKEQLKTDVTNFKVGDGVRVHTRVVEGDKERIQIFAGIVIGRKGRWDNQCGRDDYSPQCEKERGQTHDEVPHFFRLIRRSVVGSVAIVLARSC